MSDVKWFKHPEGVRLETAIFGRVLTVAELEEGLRVAKKKPVFTAVSPFGDVNEYQKQDGVVMYRSRHSTWSNAERVTLQEFNNAELEAILNARRS